MTRIRRGVTRLGLVAGVATFFPTCMGFGSDLPPKLGVVEFLAGFTGAEAGAAASNVLLGLLCGAFVFAAFAGIGWVIDGFGTAPVSHTKSDPKSVAIEGDSKSD